MGWLSGIGSAIGGWLGYKGTKQQNIASAAQAKQQMDFQERMSNTAHQRQMADMRKAGLNPILSAKYGGASSPAGQQAPMRSKAEGAMSSALNVATVNTAINTARKTGYEADILAAEIPGAQFKEDWQAALYKLWEKWFDPDDLFPASNKLMDTVTSARDTFNQAAGRTASRKYIPMDKRHLKKPNLNQTSYRKDARKAYEGMYGRKTSKEKTRSNYQRENYPKSRRYR